MNYALSLLKEIIKKRKLVWDLGKADFRKRFVGSYFGIVWMFIQPVVTIVIYADILAGVGGQGILSIAAALGSAALTNNLYMKQAETHGMSQRGGDLKPMPKITA